MKTSIDCANCKKPVLVPRWRVDKFRNCSKSCFAEYKRTQLKGKPTPQFRIPYTEDRKKNVGESLKRAYSEGRRTYRGKTQTGTEGIVRMKLRAMERDKYTCCICHLYDPEVMEVDHIKPKSTHPELNTEISNMMTLCANCHLRKTRKEKRDKVYGSGSLSLHA